MKRRSLIQGAAAAALGVPGLSGLAQQSVTLKFHTFMSPMSLVWLTMHKPWMDKVEKESNGRIKFEAYPAMQLGGTPVQLYDQARDGVVDVVWTLPGNTAGRFPRVEECDSACGRTASPRASPGRRRSRLPPRSRSSERPRESAPRFRRRSTRHRPNGAWPRSSSDVPNRPTGRGRFA